MEGGFSILLAGLLILAITVVVILWSSRRKRVPGKNWLTSDGVVHISRNSTRLDSHGEEYYDPRIVCLYKVNNIPYSITLEYPFSRKCTQREWENIARYYPSGYTVTVYYDPKKPRKAIVLEDQG
jgi:hypothetical protein